MIRKDKVETRYFPEMSLMLSIGVIRAMVVFASKPSLSTPEGWHIGNRGSKTCGYSIINHQSSIINPIAIANTPPLRLLNESSSLLIACDGSPKKSYCKDTALFDCLDGLSRELKAFCPGCCTFKM